MHKIGGDIYCDLWNTLRDMPETPGAPANSDDTMRAGRIYSNTYHPVLANELGNPFNCIIPCFFPLPYGSLPTCLTLKVTLKCISVICVLPLLF